MPTLETIGHALYGSAWQRALATALRVNERTVRRWYAGDYRIPDGVWPELRDLLTKHGAECQRIARTICAP